ncbi:MAG: serine/arginine repetitive matrix protein 2 [Clostridia bacterium]|nr:serine/arginine repetitive matrix protein 2 [Clostridia bacterium]
MPEKRVTRHNGRAGKNGVYNPKHNDRSFNLSNAEHIDSDNAKYNVLWDCYHGYTYLEKRNSVDELAVHFEEVERRFYFDRYFDYCYAQHERNKKNGHSERDREPDDLRLDKRTCPEESIIQIGNMDNQIPPEVFFDIAVEFFKEFDERFGEYVHIIDWALHVDESTPHIHERHVFDCENRYGEIMPQQEKALEMLNIDLPFPNKPVGKHNNRKMKFDSICRCMLIDVCKKHGIVIEEEPIYGGREYLEKQDYIREKLQEKIAEENETLQSKQAELKEIKLKISDAERFADDVAEVAYEKAVEVVTDKVREETRTEDYNMISDYRKRILNSPKVSKEAKNHADNLLNLVMKKLKDMTKQIAERLDRVFSDPAQKEELKKPVKESILAKLEANKQKVARQSTRQHDNHIHRNER